MEWNRERSGPAGKLVCIVMNSFHSIFMMRGPGDTVAKAQIKPCSHVVNFPV